MDALTVQRLTLAYMRRRKAENEALALEVVALLGQAMGGSAESQPKPSRKINKVPGSMVLDMMGVKL